MLSSKICNRNGATVSEAVSQLKFQQMTFLGPANGTHDQGSKHHALSSSLPLVARGTSGTAFHCISHVPFQGTWLQPWIDLTKKKKKKKPGRQLVCAISAETQAFRSEHRFTSSGGKNGSRSNAKGTPQPCTATPNMGWEQRPQSRVIFLYCLMTSRVVSTVPNITSSMEKKKHKTKNMSCKDRGCQLRSNLLLQNSKLKAGS